MLSTVLETITEAGVLSPQRLADRLNMSVAGLANLLRLHRNTLANPGSPLVQERLGEIARILNKASALTDDPARAVIWFRYQPIVGFDNKTAEELVAQGRSASVLRHLEDLVDGVYA